MRERIRVLCTQCFFDAAAQYVVMYVALMIHGSHKEPDSLGAASPLHTAKYKLGTLIRLIDDCLADIYCKTRRTKSLIDFEIFCSLDYSTGLQ